MIPTFAPISVRRPFAISLVLGVALATSGCAYTMGDFSRGSTAAATPASDATMTGAPPVQPATYVVDTTDKPYAAPATLTSLPQGGASASAAAPAATGAFPNLNQVPEGPKSKLLTPEEKAKVMSDLEALAKSQEAAVEKSRKASASACGNSVKNSLDPEARLKSEAAGQGC